jgi:hypothetical protein
MTDVTTKLGSESEAESNIGSVQSIDAIEDPDEVLNPNENAEENAR